MSRAADRGVQGHQEMRLELRDARRAHLRRGSRGTLGIAAQERELAEEGRENYETRARRTETSDS